jgi:phospholipase C
MLSRPTIERGSFRIAVFLTLVALSAISVGCGSSGSGTVLTPTLSSILVTPANGSVAQGMTQQFKATGTYADNSTQDLTSTVTWSSSATNVLTISATGFANGVGFGMTTVKATASTASGVVSGITQFSITAAAVSEVIQHVVIILQENRTPDNLFHGLPNADIANSGTNSSGQTVPLTETSLATNYDLDHSHNGFVEMYDGGKMDGADKIGIRCAKGAINCPPAQAQFQYVNPSEVMPYFQLAEQYTFGDRMFQTNQGPSFPAHQFIISGTSADTATSNLFASENPVVPAGAAPTGEGAGCNAPVGTLVNMIDPSGVESSRMYPCFEHPTLTDSLDAQAVDWRYYAPSAAGLSIWVGPDAIQHIRFGGDWNKVILNQTQVLTDIANNQLAQVTWVIPSGQASDHANVNNGTGPSWVASVVNAIGNSPYWSKTVIIIAWDDWGGWYDHVPPPSIANSYEYGFRVPLIVVSPYAKRGYVSHVAHNFGSILNLIEEVFKLPSLGYADARSDDLSDCLDLTQVPPPFATIAAKFSAKHFLNDKRASLPPDDDDR